MAAKKPTEKGDIPIQPDLARMNADGVDVAGVIALLGYIGVPPEEGVVRLHPRLGDLSVGVDIAATDILMTREVPASSAPFGAFALWVSRTADVTVRRTSTVAAKAQQVRQLFGPAPESAASSGDSGNRLNIRLHQDRVPPIYDCNRTCVSKECGGTSQCLPPCQSKM